MAYTYYTIESIPTYYYRLIIYTLIPTKIGSFLILSFGGVLIFKVCIFLTRVGLLYAKFLALTKASNNTGTQTTYRSAFQPHQQIYGLRFDRDMKSNNILNQNSNFNKKAHQQSLYRTPLIKTDPATPKQIPNTQKMSHKRQHSSSLQSLQQLPQQQRINEKKISNHHVLSNNLKFMIQKGTPIELNLMYSEDIYCLGYVVLYMMTGIRFEGLKDITKDERRKGIQRLADMLESFGYSRKLISYAIWMIEEETERRMSLQKLIFKLKMDEGKIMREQIQNYKNSTRNSGSQRKGEKMREIYYNNQILGTTTSRQKSESEHMLATRMERELQQLDRELGIDIKIPTTPLVRYSSSTYHQQKESMHSDSNGESKRNNHMNSRKPFHTHSHVAVAVDDVKSYPANHLFKNRSPVHSTNIHLSPIYTTPSNYVQSNMTPIVTSFNIAADSNHPLSPRNNAPYINLYRSQAKKTNIAGLHKEKFYATSPNHLQPAKAYADTLSRQRSPPIRQYSQYFDLNNKNKNDNFIVQLPTLQTKGNGSKKEDLTGRFGLVKSGHRQKMGLSPPVTNRFRSPN